LKDESTFWEDLKSGKFISMVKESSRGKMLCGSKEVFHIMRPVFCEVDDVEMFYCIYMDTRNRILAIEKMATGTIAGAVIYPRELIKEVIRHKATAIIITHNHPSGNPEPSDPDKHLTIQLLIALASIDVKLHDHIIVGDDYYSMADNGFIQSVSNRFAGFVKDTL
jgi:DNA repair protein RadC